MKTAMITGVTGGIGKATAQKFLDEGYFVCGNGRSSDPEKLPRGENFLYYCGDISGREERAAFIQKALSGTGKIDVLVNVAGMAPRVRSDLLDMSEESYDEVLSVNTKSVMFLTQAVAKLMKDNEPSEDGNRGYICNISSMSAYTSSTSRGEYCISKAGVSMITTLFADRLAEYGIPVNEIRPGIIATGMTAVVKGKYDKLIGEGLLPIKRWGKPEDIAAAVWALCSGALPYVTGQSINVDGGFHIRRL